MEGKRKTQDGPVSMLGEKRSEENINTRRTAAAVAVINAVAEASAV